ncbi:BREX-2 system adenine-specific DNA-methyltransferase PglX [Thermobifida fusca]|uniref:BREX-2 system adenine-specific DNA-methyltransferase PglX n=1 Tax=Thermobifida fusca TaxID=2021 RepID=UPI00241C28C3|nr:BREX-2 system adenine-specific DNA-methyltransferase PglX [Thermobifida fusca]
MADHKDRGELLTELRHQVTLLEEDLHSRSEEDEYAAVLETEYRAARQAQRTAAPYPDWRNERITQVAAAWVLGTLFVRFCEDNGLVEQPWIAGPGDRLAAAQARQRAFFATTPNLNDRDWLISAFVHLAKCHRTTEGLFSRSYNPLWQLTPGVEAIGSLLEFWRRRGPDGTLIHDFTDPDLDTRFLAELYQELSESARAADDLLPTPDFVVDFLLDLTLEPAIDEFGLDPELDVHDSSGAPVWRHRGLRTVDPACGSGEFLLGLFTRILARNRAAAGPGADRWELVRKALNSVHGCDKNPFAANIARFRLLIAVLRETGARRLDQAPDFPVHIAVGDALLHGRDAAPPDHSLDADGVFTYTTEDIGDLVRRVDLLGRNSYHVVVTSPPAVPVRDPQDNVAYRSRYDVCSGTYPLVIPFAQRIFQLASRERAGFAAQFAPSAFLRREFGRRLVEDFYGRTVKLTHVVDTSGAVIPGRTAPTAIVVGRNTDRGWADPIREVLGVRGEPVPPENPAQGMVWRSIVENIQRPGIETSWVRVRNSDRDLRIAHPWSLNGDGADELRRQLDTAPGRLDDRVAEIGTMARLRDDCCAMVGEDVLRRAGISPAYRRPVADGDAIRDFHISDPVVSLWPYAAATLAPELSPEAERFLWPYRTLLRSRADQSSTPDQHSPLWYAYPVFHTGRYRAPLLLAYAETATHPHVALVRGGMVLRHTAPVLQLPEGATEDDYLRLLGVLNSSAVCFWLKQDPERDPRGAWRDPQEESWEERHRFTAARMRNLPLPAHLPVEPGRSLDTLARQAAAWDPVALADREVPTRQRFAEARRASETVRHRMVALHEELDWQVYGLYGLLSESEAAAVLAPDPARIPEIAPGERAFEIVLARQIAVGDSATTWFARNAITPVTELPQHWPEEYRRVVEARIDLIEKRRDLALVESPDYKRRWHCPPWQERQGAALRHWLLSRCEQRDLWFDAQDGREVPRPRSLADLAERLLRAPDRDAVAAVAEWYADEYLGQPEARLADVLAELVADQHVPFLAAYRYRAAGLHKYARWQEVWAAQQEEDSTGQRAAVPPPPTYAAADFRARSYWANRGRLDLPRERFVSYPGVVFADDPTMVVGWAGWDDAQRAEALIWLVDSRAGHWSREQVIPLLAGVYELLPWLRRWHGGPLAARVARWLTAQQEQYGLSDDHLTTWRPA